MANDKKWDPLQAILDSNSKALSAKDYLDSVQRSESVVDIEIDKIIRWEFKDRPENELGDITSLAETFTKIGQQQPCILRKSKKQPGKYELIVGERRWKAAEKAGIRLKAIIKDIDDKTAAIIQAIENEKRKDLSDYAKGMSYADKIEKGLLTQTELTDILKISRQQVSRLLSYSKIPSLLSSAIGDFRKVSSRTAYELSRLAKKDDNHLNALIQMASKISSGEYGAKKIQQELIKVFSEDKTSLDKDKYFSNKNGVHLFTVKLNSKTPSIVFSKEISTLITESIIKEIQLCIEKNLD